MKKLTSIILILFLSLLSSQSWSVFLTMDDLVERDGLIYKKFTDVPFTGEVSGKIQGWFKDGKEDGKWIAYHDNGQLYYKGEYKDGKQEGVWVGYWENGQLDYKGEYKNGKREGEWVQYWNNGQLNYKAKYFNGLEEGNWVVYGVDGSLIEEYSGFFRNGVKQ